MPAVNFRVRMWQVSTACNGKDSRVLACLFISALSPSHYVLFLCKGKKAFASPERLYSSHTPQREKKTKSKEKEDDKQIQIHLLFLGSSDWGDDLFDF
ncbi:hypothetical protein MRB53_018033 [Persea americana]|uniref:Uncharacterized protein n=1 Tax=Persea americana TaxID=3435 RepID=A0ACC2M7P9_PERAE|nr:hypothetical protein MRB53_018033 [Persea americana]